MSPPDPKRLQQFAPELYEVVQRMLAVLDERDAITFHDEAVVEVHAVMAAIRGEED